MVDDERLFEPEPGDVGSWVMLPNGSRGQVWAKVGCRRPDSVSLRDRLYAGACSHKGGCPPAVWVADGDEFVEVLLDDIEQPRLEGEIELF